MTLMPAATAAAVSSPTTYTIQGRTVEMPVYVRDASSGAATFVVPTAAARRLIPAALEPLELLPGRALMSLAAIEYRDNDLGRYNEVSIAFFVRVRGSGGGVPYVGTIVDFLRARAATYIHRLPVDGSFTCEAGRTIWGFPKTVETIEVSRPGGRSECRLVADGRHALTLTLPRGGTRKLPDAEMVTYSFIDGVLHRTEFSSGGEGVGFHLGGAEVVLGEHPIADELRSLGFPRRALMTMWMERMHGRFETPQRVGAGSRLVDDRD
jgi:hypothetical protein